MCGIKQARQLWTVRQARLKATSMAEPNLPFTLFRLDCEATRVYIAFCYSGTAEAAWAPFDELRTSLCVLPSTHDGELYKASLRRKGLQSHRLLINY